jgi:hypothetical protein
MHRRARLARMTSPPSEWTRRQAQWLVAALALAGTLLCAGVVVVADPRGSEAEDKGLSPTSHQATAASDEDRIADRPLPSAPLDAARPGELSTDSYAPVVIPSASGVGAAGVPTGFPQTVEGAIAQLAAIDEATLESASIARAQEIVRAWAAPGGPTDQSWTGVQAMATLLTAAGLPSDADDAVDVEVLPAMTMVKGQLTVASASSVPDPVGFVVPCLDMVVTLTLGGSAHRIAVADCQRMVWRDGRWMIGPGPEPSPAPSLWPGTPASYAVGFRWIETTSA